MSELDDLFKLDGGLDLLDKNVHQKYGASNPHHPPGAPLTSPGSKPSISIPRSWKSLRPVSGQPKNASSRLGLRLQAESPASAKLPSRVHSQMWIRTR